MLPIEHLKKANTTGNLWLYILAILDNKPLYGWEIPNLIEKEFGFRPGKITPYRVFYRLETDGFVKSEMDARRRIYNITPKGREELHQAKLFYKDILDKIHGQ